MSEIKIIKLSLNRWKEYRDLRLESLKTEPQAFTAVYEEQLKRSDDVWRERLVQKDSASIRLFAEVEKELVGTVACFREKSDPTISTINNVYVKPDYRGQGIGKLLLKNMLSELGKLEDIKKVCLTVTETQKTAISTYKSCGFQELKILRNAVEFGDKKYDEIVMERKND